MAEKACHVFGSTAQVGLTQALGVTADSFSALASSAGPSLRVGRRGLGLHRLRLVSFGNFPAAICLHGFGGTVMTQ
jgi:hypothetical protein